MRMQQFKKLIIPTILLAILCACGVHKKLKNEPIDFNSRLVFEGKNLFKLNTDHYYLRYDTLPSKVYCSVNYIDEHEICIPVDTNYGNRIFSYGEKNSFLCLERKDTIILEIAKSKYIYTIEAGERKTYCLQSCLDCIMATDIKSFELSYTQEAIRNSNGQIYFFPSKGHVFHMRVTRKLNAKWIPYLDEIYSTLNQDKIVLNLKEFKLGEYMIHCDGFINDFLLKIE